MINAFLDWAQQQQNGTYSLSPPLHPSSHLPSHSLDRIKRAAPRLGPGPQTRLATRPGRRSQVFHPPSRPEPEDLQWDPAE